MASMQLDIIDLPPGALFLLGALASLGLIDATIPLTGWDLADTAWTLAAEGEAVPLSVAKIMSLIGVLWALATNDIGWRGWTSLQMFLAVATFGLVLSPPFVPLLDAVLMGSDIAKVVSLTVQMYGFAVISYIG